jgi:hypothetical protein
LYEWNASTRRWTPEEVPAANVANLQPTTDAALRAQVADVQRQLYALNARLRLLGPFQWILFLIFLEAVALFLPCFDPGEHFHSASLIVIVRILLWVYGSLRYVLAKPHRRHRRRLNLSYRQRILRLTSCIRSQTKWKHWIAPRSSRLLRTSRINTLLAATKWGKVEILNGNGGTSLVLDPVEVTSFLQTFNPLVHHHQLMGWRFGTTPTEPIDCWAILYCAGAPPFALSAHHSNPNAFQNDPQQHSCLDHEVPIVIDTGASWSVTPCVQDFVSTISSSFEQLRSLDGSINVSGSGFIEWRIQDQHGVIKTIRTRALYVPTAGVRLFSPQSYFKENNDGSLLCEPDGLLL